jgi:hypothetical protein
MQKYGRAAISEFLGDFIVYRNLVPADDRLPPMEILGRKIGLAEGRIPRKTEMEYAQVIVHLLELARALDAPGERIQRVIFLGDTRLLDATAFINICQAGGWTGAAFIGAENSKPAQVDLERTDGGGILYLANRWAALADFERYCLERELVFDPATAVLVDMDKTAIGARGRNAQVIDGARVQAVRETVAGLLGEAFDSQSFETAYALLNQPEFHPFTVDNQDYLAYICLILGAGLDDLDSVASKVRAGQLVSFEQFIQKVDGRSAELSPELAAIHRKIYASFQAGDPTPFKAFRRSEYRITVGRMGHLPDHAPVEALLAAEIVITQEVREMALKWRQQGALLFGLSDKPDEASVPTVELAARGYQPIHRTETHIIGT